jgi:hypothetical protein
MTEITGTFSGKMTTEGAKARGALRYVRNANFGGDDVKNSGFTPEDPLETPEAAVASLPSKGLGNSFHHYGKIIIETEVLTKGNLELNSNIHYAGIQGAGTYDSNYPDKWSGVTLESYTDAWMFRPTSAWFGDPHSFSHYCSIDNLLLIGREPWQNYPKTVTEEVFFNDPGWAAEQPATISRKLGSFLSDGWTTEDIVEVWRSDKNDGCYRISRVDHTTLYLGVAIPNEKGWRRNEVVPEGPTPNVTLIPLRNGLVLMDKGGFGTWIERCTFGKSRIGIYGTRNLLNLGVMQCDAAGLNRYALLDVYGLTHCHFEGGEIDRGGRSVFEIHKNQTGAGSYFKFENIKLESGLDPNEESHYRVFNIRPMENGAGNQHLIDLDGIHAVGPMHHRPESTLIWERGGMGVPALVRITGTCTADRYHHFFDSQKTNYTADFTPAGKIKDFHSISDSNFGAGQGHYYHPTPVHHSQPLKMADLPEPGPTRDGLEFTVDDPEAGVKGKVIYLGGERYPSKLGPKLD